MQSESTETTKCKLCGSNEVSWGQLCDACKGKSVDSPPDNSKPTQTCATCGGPFEPYRVGPNWVRQPTQCFACLMRKKYGPDWKPGITKADRKLMSLRKKRAEKKVVAENKMVQPAKSVSDATIMLTFDGPDVAMYERILEIANRERRTVDQQVLFFMDGVLGRE